MGLARVESVVERATKVLHFRRTPNKASTPESAETQQPKLRELRKVRLNSRRELKAVVDPLNHPANRRHIVNPPKTPEELKETARTPGRYIFVGIDHSGDVASTAAVEDAPTKFRNDHFAAWGSVRQDLQGQGVGTETLVRVTDLAFKNKARGGIERRKLYASYIDEIEGSEIVRHVIQDKVGYKYEARFERQVNVPVLGENGNIIFERGRMVTEKKPVVRNVMYPEVWNRIKAERFPYLK